MKLIDYIRQAPAEEVADIIGRVICLRMGIESDIVRKTHFNAVLKVLETDIEQIAGKE